MEIISKDMQSDAKTRALIIVSLLASVMFIFLIGLQFASATLEPVEQGECVDLLGSNGPTPSMNISSITYPNQTTMYQTIEMTKNDKTFSYHFCDTQQMGGYVYNYYEADGTTWVNDFTVNALGLEQTTGQAMGSLAYLILMLFLTVAFIITGLYLKGDGIEKNAWWFLGVFLIFLSALLMVYDVWLGYEYHRSFTGLADSAMPETIFWIFLLIVVLGLLAGASLLFLRWKEVLEWFKKTVHGGDTDDYDVDLGFDKYDSSFNPRGNN